MKSQVRTCQFYKIKLRLHMKETNIYIKTMLDRRDTRKHKNKYIVRIN